MAHPKAVPVELGGQTRHLVYDLNALCRLRDEGVGFDKLNEQDMADPRLVRKLVWAGLLEENPDLTLDAVGKWIDLQNLATVAGAFTDAFAKSVGTELGDPQ